MKAIRAILLLGAASLLAPAVAHAQFQGDVFFAEPSVAVAAGGTAIVEVQLFSGADPVGATHVDLLFDPNQAEVVEVEPGTTPQLANGLAEVRLADRVALVDLNGSSLDQPFGTVSLARVHIRPLGGAGSRVPLTLQVHSLLRQDSSPFPAAQGFSGEILVVSPGGVAPAAGKSALHAPSRESTLRAMTFRRPGLAVDLLDFDREAGKVSAVRHRLVIPDPAASREAPVP